MPTVRTIVVTAGLLALGGPALAAAITDIQPIPLRSGVNPVPHLAPDGRDGVIVQGDHQDSPSADGISVQFIVLLRNGDRWETVDVQPARPDEGFGEELVRSIPHAGEDWKRTISFARAKIDGAPAFVMLVAERDMSKAETAYTPVPVDVLTFRMTKDPDLDQDHLVLVDKTRSKGCYQNAWLALKDMTGAPLPADYDGPAAAQRCAK